MKIIIVPNSSKMTGRHYNIAKNLLKNGHEVHYFIWDLPYNIGAKDMLTHLVTSMASKDYKYEELFIHKARRLPYFWPYINGLIFRYQLNKLYEGINADYIFSESYTNETSVSKKLPFVYDLADDYAAPAEVYGSKIYKFAFKILQVRRTMEKQSKNAIAVTVVSGILKDFASKYNQKVFVLPNGVNVDIIDKAQREKKKKNNKYSMIYVTGFGKWSRVVETMKAVVLLRKEFPDLDLTLVGEGPETEKIINFIKDKGAEKFIHYLGFIYDQNKVFKLIANSEIGLNVSDKNKWRDAAHPIKVLEYSAMGKKVVSTDLSGVKSLKYPNLFIFSDKDSKSALTNAMRLALTTEIDNKKYREVRSAVVRDYNWDLISIQLVNIFRYQSLQELKG